MSENRELTILLKLAAASDNGRTASDVVRQVADAQKAAEAFATVHREAAKTASEAAANASTFFRQLTDELKKATTESASMLGTMQKTTSATAQAATVQSKMATVTQQTATAVGNAAASSAQFTASMVGANNATVTLSASQDELLARISALMQRTEQLQQQMASGIGIDDAELDAIGKEMEELVMQYEALDTAAKQTASANAQLHRSGMQMLEATKQLTSGMTSLARSVVLLGIADEENMETMLRTIATFEAGAQAINGLISVVQASVKMWQAYRAAVLAAAAADAVKAATGAAAGSGSIGSAIGGFVGRSGGLVGAGGALLRGAGGLAARGFAAAGGAAGLGFGAAALGGGLLLGEGLSRAATGGRTGTVSELFGYMQDRRNAAETVARGERMEEATRRRRAEIARRDALDIGNFRASQSSQMFADQMAAGMAGMGLSGSARDRAINDSRRASMQRAASLDVNSTAFESQSASVMLAQIDQQIAAQTELASLEAERLDILKKANQEALDLEKSRLGVIEQSLAAVGRELDMAKASRQGEAGAILNMTDVERQQLQIAAGRARAGQQLTQADLGILRPFGEFRDTVASEELRLARGLDTAGILAPQDANVARLEQQKQKLEVDLNTQSTIIVELGKQGLAEETKLLSEIRATIQEIMRQREEALKEQLRLEFAIQGQNERARAN